MQRDYVYPEVGDRSSPKEWNENGRPEALHLARARLDTLLSSHWPDHIDRALDEALQSDFPIRLPMNSR